MIRAKMKCSMLDNASGVYESVRFDAVYSDDPNSENYSWSKWTPSGYLTLSISNPECFGKFEVGKEYFIDISEVP